MATDGTGAAPSTSPIKEIDRRLASQMRRLLVGVAFVLLAVLAIQQLELTPQFLLTRRLMQLQDLPVLILTGSVLVALAVWRLPAAWGRWGEHGLTMRQSHVFLLILGAGIIAALGTRLVALNFGISRDEMMVVFDAQIFSSGRLLAAVAPEWRPFVPALHPDFRLPVSGNAAWVSTYLPGNAAVRAVLGKVFDVAVINGALVVVSLIALFGIAQQIWPQRRDAWIVAVVLAASSAQVLCMAMTPFAMSMHLALNLIWLWLFLRQSALGHVLAIVVGFLATGLHQIVFHPLFVAPFLLQVLLERRWRLSAFYAVSYAGIGIFWILYWQWLLAGQGLAAEGAGNVGLTYFISRVTALLTDFSFYGIETMLQNLLRFAAWQNPMLLVLLVPGMALAWTTGGVLRSLAVGIVLTISAMFVLLPNQDIGWGYRYIHGLIGNAALLAAFGWISLTSGLKDAQRQPLSGLFAVTAVLSMLVLLPIHAVQMRNHIAPYAHAQAAVFGIKADAVVVETVSIYYGIDLVRNDPFLHNRPLTFDIGLLDEALVRELCARMSVAMFDGRDAARHGVLYTDPATHPEWTRMKQLRQLIESDECRQLRRGR